MMGFYDDIQFPESDEPWLPTLLDIEQFKSEEVPGFSNVGFSAIVIPAALTNLTTHRSDITTRFNERFYNRRINSETLERWQVRLQNRFDEICTEWERAYTLYSQYDTDMKNKIVRGTTHAVSTMASGTSSSDTSSKQIDTPDAAINANDNYADALTKGSSSGSSSSSVMSTDTLTYQGDVVEDVNKAIEAYKDIDTFFLDKFENLFLNVFWS